MHSAEGAMFPIAKAALSFLDISDYWSREIRPPASKDELLDTLVSAWWLGELRGDSAHSRLEYLKSMFTSMYRDDRIIFLVGDDACPPTFELPDGSLRIDLRPTIRVPSSNIESWDEIACRDAFQALAQISSIQSYLFAIGLTLIKLTYEEFNTWLQRRGYSAPTFWQHPDLAHRHHAGAASSTGSADGAPHLGRVGPKKERKTWQAKPGKRLTASEIAVLNAINTTWPDGTLDHKAKARDKRIQEWLTLNQQSSVKTRTIQRTLVKIHFD
jgi:hypothetical protein